MTLNEREIAVLDGFERGLRYQEVADELELDKNKIYKAVKKLEHDGFVERLTPGAYKVLHRYENGAIDLPIPKPTKQKQIKPEPPPTIEPPIEVPAPIAEPIVEALPVTDIEKIAAKLVDKIAYLQPLLMLHKDLFGEIESVTLALVNEALEIKSRTLTKTEWENYRELKEIEHRAIQIVNTTFKK